MIAVAPYTVSHISGGDNCFPEWFYWRCQRVTDSIRAYLSLKARGSPAKDFMFLQFGDSKTKQSQLVLWADGFHYVKLDSLSLSLFHGSPWTLDSGISWSFNKFGNFLLKLCCLLDQAERLKARVGWAAKRIQQPISRIYVLLCGHLIADLKFG